MILKTRQIAARRRNVEEETATVLVEAVLIVLADKRMSVETARQMIIKVCFVDA